MEVLSPDPASLRPPSDSDLRVHRDRDRTEFVRRGRIDPVFGSITCILVFWNGVLGVFLLDLVRDFRWSQFYFLIPFEVIGSCLFLAWLALLTAPLQVEKWIIRPHEVEARISILGLCRSWYHETRFLARVELRRCPGRVLSPEEDSPYCLGLVGKDGTDLLVIDGLTEGEARWMGGEFLQPFKGSLSRAGKMRLMESRPSDPLWDRELDR